MVMSLALLYHFRMILLYIITVIITGIMYFILSLHFYYVQQYLSTCMLKCMGPRRRSMDSCSRCTSLAYFQARPTPPAIVVVVDRRALAVDSRRLRPQCLIPLSAPVGHTGGVHGRQRGVRVGPLVRHEGDAGRRLKRVQPQLFKL